MFEQEDGKNLYQDLLLHSQWDLDGSPIGFLSHSLFAHLIVRCSLTCWISIALTEDLYRVRYALT